MLGPFAEIVNEIVRGAEELQKALLRARADLAAAAAGLKGPVIPPVGGAVLDLDRLTDINARALSRAWAEAAAEAGGRRSSSAPETPESPEVRRLRETLGKLAPPAEEIARKLGRREEIPGEGRERRGSRRSEAAGPRQGGILQRVLASRRGRIWRRRLERSPSPLRRYVGESLARYARHGRIRGLFADLRRAPQAMKTAGAAQSAARAGISAAQLARGANMVGLAGRAGTAAAGLAGAAAGPFGLLIAAVVAATAVFVKLSQAAWKFLRAQEDAVLKTQQYAADLGRVHAGMAALSAELEMVRLREQQRQAAGTYATTRWAAEVQQRYRRESEELRILVINLQNLGKVLAVYGARTLEYTTMIGMMYGLLKRLAGPINNYIDQWLADHGKGGRGLPWVEWLDPYRLGQVDLGRRPPPREPFNKGPGR